VALLSGSVSALVSAVVCWLIYRLGPRTGLIDAPDKALKPHGRPVVALGGLGILLGLHVGLLVADTFSPALLTATGFIWLMGVVDDRIGLSPLIRLGGAAVAGLILVMSEVPGGLDGQVFWLVVTVVVINAVNLMDGLDGLVAAVSIPLIAGLAVFGGAQVGLEPLVYVVAVGAVAGFLVWNWAPARIFLGDNGAYVVAVTITWLALASSPDRMGSLIAVALIGVPLIELGVTIARRLLARRPLTVGDRDHTYDRLASKGWSHRRVATTFASTQLIWSAVVLAASFSLSDGWTTILAGVLGSGVVVVTALVMSKEQMEHGS
jgi:UDP-GlcNAc:undecaprenyl-phosphate/decaprenyl-phosphate GlcNAc-1-phosphate transferase